MAQNAGFGTRRSKVRISFAVLVAHPHQLQHKIATRPPLGWRMGFRLFSPKSRRERLCHDSLRIRFRRKGECFSFAHDPP
jgi:hypothetical protein